jgi:hypothetical protein
MKFFDPQIQLTRWARAGQPDSYSIHVVTFCPKTTYAADGHTIDNSQLGQDLFKLRVKLRTDNALPEMDYITPVVHTIDLGPIDFPNELGGWIQVEVFGVQASDRSGGSPGGVRTVSSTDSDDKSRPGGN